MKLISLAQKGVAPKLANIAQHSPVPMPQMQYPAHLTKPKVASSSSAQQATPQTKAAPPDPFGGLTSDLGFPDLGTNSGATTKGGGTAVQWETPMGGPVLNGHSAVNGMSSLGGGLDGNGAFDAQGFGSPAMGGTPSKSEVNSVGVVTPSGKAQSVTINPNVNVNEYGPVSHMKHGHTHTLTVDNSPMGPSTTLVSGSSDEVKPPGLSRRQSTKILYQEERLREQIRQAEQREKMARKQANTQRIENERLERENETLKLEVNAARQAQAEALKQSQEALNSIQPLRLENEKLKQAITEWRELIQTKDEELEALEGDLDELRLKNERLENEVRDDKSKIDDLQFKLERSEALLEELTKKDEEGQRALSALKQERSMLEDEKRTMDLQIAQIKDEMKKMKRKMNSGLGLDRNTLKKKEADLFNINDIALDVAPPSKPLSVDSPVPGSATATVSASPSPMPDIGNVVREASPNLNDGARSDSDDKGAAPPGSHDFNFAEINEAVKSDEENGININSVNGHNADINQFGPGAAPSSSSRFPDDNANGSMLEEGGNDGDDEPDFIEKVVKEEVEVEEIVIKEAPFGEEFKSSEWFMSASDVANYHKYFIQADTNKDGVIDGNEAQKFFMKSKLNRKLLAKIWVISDQKKQGKLSEAMFCSMFHIVMKIRKSGGKLTVPSELPECLREDNVLKLGSTVPVRVKEKKMVIQTKTVRVENPNKRKSNKKKKTPPPLPQESKDDDLGFGANDEWDNNFSFGNEENTTTAKDTSTQNAKVSSQTTAGGDDDNWNAFGDDFGF